MVIKKEDGQLWITTTIYQARNGGVFMPFGNTVIKLTREEADAIAYDLPDFDYDLYIKHYQQN